GINAGLSFQLMPRFVAGLWAGACFVGIGAFILTYICRWNFRTKSPLFWSAFIFTFVFAIPMVVARLVTPRDEAVGQVLTIPMGYVHLASTWMYYVMMGATVLEMALEIVKMRKKSPKI